MLDLVQTQKDLFGVLTSNDYLQSVNIVLQRKMQLQSELNFSQLWQTPRGGKAGAGVLVEMPAADSNEENITGPVLNWLFTMLIVENPPINESPAGTNLSAEMIAQMVLDAVHLYGDQKIGTFKINRSAVNQDMSFAGCIGYRVVFSLIAGKSQQTPRCGVIAVTIVGGNLTLACATVGAEIRYTTDGTWPARDSSSQVYSGPVPVQSGDVIRAVAFADGFNNGPAAYAVAP